MEMAFTSGRAGGARDERAHPEPAVPGP